MVKPESGDVVQQWVLRIVEARTLLDNAATSVAATINDDDKRKNAPSIVRLLFDETKEWEKDEKEGEKGAPLKAETLTFSLQFLHDTSALTRRGRSWRLIRRDIEICMSWL